VTVKAWNRLKKTPAITQDGTEIKLLANIELPADSAAALEAGANGVGLFRSEFLFLGRAGHLEKFPSEDEQFESYRQAVVAMKGGRLPSEHLMSAQTNRSMKMNKLH